MLGELLANSTNPAQFDPTTTIPPHEVANASASHELDDRPMTRVIRIGFFFSRPV